MVSLIGRPRTVGYVERLVVPELGPCREWAGARFKDGYGQRQYKGKTTLAHRAAWDEEVGPIPEGKLILHRCDNKPCCRMEHLFIGTQKDNMQDRIAKGRPGFSGHQGEKNPFSKLTEADVRAIRAATDRTHQSLADEYGVVRNAITNIINRKSWRHI